MTENSSNEKEIKNAELIIPSSERREYPRIALSTPIKYSILKQRKENLDQDKLIKEGFNNLYSNNVKVSETINLSSGGLLMVTEEEINTDSILHITMHIPLPGISCNCSMLGKVVRCERKEDKKYNIAVKFLKIIHHNLNKYKYATLKDLLNLEGPQIKID